ncbi:MAG TPA: PepSY domain-containing protein [Polyangiaceae bacterium LLY-WYZ-14_1]|nr:PepSY domain-containing protein [Polyangiaceae bacterium LLY-WYZ-14_1]
MKNVLALSIASILGLGAQACTSDARQVDGDRIASLYGEESRSGDCAMTADEAREAALRLFPSSTVVEVDADEAVAIESWEVELRTENGGEAEAEFFVASCGLYEAESDDTQVAFEPGDLVTVGLADALGTASDDRLDQIVEWELERDEDHDGGWVYDVELADGRYVAVSASTGAVIAEDDDDGDEDLDDDLDEDVDEDLEDDLDDDIDEDADEDIDEDIDEDADEDSDDDLDEDVDEDVDEDADEGSDDDHEGDRADDGGES